MTTRSVIRRWASICVSIYSILYIDELYAEELKILAIELQDLIQAKVGTTKFANTYSKIRQGVLTVRRDRKTSRVTQVHVYRLIL